MAIPLIGEIKMFAGNFAPAGWGLCDGTSLPVLEDNDYWPLFQLIGTTYGGDGVSTFNLPDLRGRLPVHCGTTFTLAQTGGVEEVTLTTFQMPSHTHPVAAVAAVGNNANLGGNVLASSSRASLYRAPLPAPPATLMASQASGIVGGSQPHTNMQRYACVNFIIALFGAYPQF